MNIYKIPIALIIALVGFPQISETIYTPALPSVAAGLETSAYLVESTLAIYFLGFALGVSIWGAVSDWIGRRASMLAGICIYILGSILCANAGTINALLFCRLLQAFGASVGSIISQTMIRDAFDGPARLKLFAIISAALSFSPALGPVIGGYLSQIFDWRANFWFLVFMGAFLLITSFKILPETKPQHVDKPNFNQIKQLIFKMFASSSLWGHVLLIGATNGIIFSFYQEAPFIFIEQKGMEPSHYGLFGLIIAAATIAAARLSVKLSSAFKPESIIKTGCLICFGGSLAFVIIAINDLISISLGGLSLTTLALFTTFLGIGLIIPNSLSMALKPFQGAVGTAGSIFGFLYYCFISLFAWLMGFIHNGTVYPMPIYFLGLSTLIVFAGTLVQARIKETVINQNTEFRIQNSE